MQLNTQTEIKQKTTIRKTLAKAIDWRFIFLGIFTAAASHTVMFDCMAPFGLAMLAACYKRRRWNFYALLMHTVGCILISTAGFDTVSYIIGGIILLLLLKLYKDMPAPLAAPLTLIAVRIPAVIAGGGYIYDISMLAVEISLCAVFTPVFSKFVQLLMTRTAKRHPDSDDVFAMFSAMCIAVMSCAEVILPFNINLSAFMSAYLIMMMSIAGGFSFGVASGAVLGIVSRLYILPDPAIIGVYAVCGLLCGTVRRLGKWGIIAGFILTNSLFVLFAPLQVPSAFTAGEQAAAALLFLLTGKKIIVFMENTLAACFPEPAYATRFKSTVNDRLVQASVALDKLSGYMKKISSSKPECPSEDLFTVYDKAANKICKNCLMCIKCWEREYDITAAALMDSASYLEEVGYLEAESLPSHFRNKCKKLKLFVDEVNKQYDNYKIEQVLKRKVSVGEDMAARQIKDFSKIIDGINSRLTREISFDTALEQQLGEALDKLPVPVYSLNAVIDHKGRYDISITIPARIETTLEEIGDAVSSAIGKKMELSCVNEEHSRATVHFTEAAPFNVECGQASAPKRGQEVCGDSKSISPLSDGRILLAISDGMGSGETAARQSDAAIELLGRFLDAGFDTQSTLRMINSILMLRDNSETFATVDIAMIDRYTGGCEFIKIGANCAYILNNHKVKQISSRSLPAGILKEVDAEKTALRLKDESYVILLSDGIESANDRWVAEYIEKLPPCTPQQLADSILKAATEHYGGREDDMTVLTAKISKGEVKYA